MLQTQTANKITMPTLSQEIELLRSAVIGWIGKDSEGEYNPQFIKQIMEASKEKNIYTFVDKKSFLQSLL